MKDVTVKVDALLDKVERNRYDHNIEYAEALRKYRTKAVAALHDLAAKVEAGEDVRLAVSLPKPEQHLDDYDAAIHMLKWHQSRMIELDEHTFRCLVLNEWPWRNSFIANTSAYLAE